MAAGSKSEVTRLIKPCTCEHPAQDILYGKGRRLHKRVIRNKGSMMERVEDRCTVCFMRPIRLGGHGSPEIKISFRTASWPLKLGRIGPIRCK